MQFWLLQILNSLALGGLLFLLSAGFSVIFGIMRIPNLTHGAYFLLGAYVGTTFYVEMQLPFLIAVVLGGAASGVLGGIVERLVLRPLASKPSSQVLATLGIAFIVADGCLWLWGGDPLRVATPEMFRRPISIIGIMFPYYRVIVFAGAIVVFAVLLALIERTRVGAMVRAGVDDMEMASGLGIPVSRLFTSIFSLGAMLAGCAGALGAPIFSVYPGLDTDMLPLALIVVILGGVGSLPGAFIGSIVVGAVSTFGQVLLPDLAYVILFVPMVVMLAVRPQGLLGRL